VAISNVKTEKKTRQERQRMATVLGGGGMAPGFLKTNEAVFTAAFSKDGGACGSAYRRQRKYGKPWRLTLAGTAGAWPQSAY
jgi:hypothetical protein